MKRTRLNKKSHTKSEKLAAIARVDSLVKNDGFTLNKARLLVASEKGMTSSGVAYWQRTLKGKKTIKSTTTAVSKVKAYQNMNEMGSAARTVLKSLIDQDGKYSIREANAIGKLYTADLGRVKLTLDVHKLNTRIANTAAHSDEILKLT